MLIIIVVIVSIFTVLGFIFCIIFNEQKLKDEYEKFLREKDKYYD